MSAFGLTESQLNTSYDKLCILFIDLTYIITYYHILSHIITCSIKTLIHTIVVEILICGVIAVLDTIEMFAITNWVPLN